MFTAEDLGKIGFSPRWFKCHIRQSKLASSSVPNLTNQPWLLLQLSENAAFGYRCLTWLGEWPVLT